MKYTTDVINHHKKGDFEYLTFKGLDKYKDKLTHFITLKHGGVSKGVYSSLNVRSVGKDDINNVLKNVEIICDNFGIDKNRVYKAKQTHTDKVLILSDENKEEYNFNNFVDKEYDAYLIKDSDISNLVTTADCNPIIIYDTKNNIVLNIHAGWKGVIKQIYLKAIQILLEKYNSSVEDLIVCIGPSIRKCCFSSEDEEFLKQFTDKFENKDKYVYYEENSKRFHIDLIYIIKQDLLNIGIKETNINVADICTCCNTQDFYSFRKATQNKDEDYATFSTWVKLN